MTRRGSIFTQMAILIALALMMAHAVNYFVILDERQRLMMSDTSGVAIQRFTEALKDLQRVQSAPDIQEVLRAHTSPGFRLHVERNGLDAMGAVRRDPALTDRLRRSLEAAGVVAVDFRLGLRDLVPPFPGLTPSLPPDAPDVRLLNNDPRGIGPPMPPPRELVLSARLGNGLLVTATTMWRPPNQNEIGRFIAMQALIYVTLLAATLWLARRIMAPLRMMAETAREVGRPGPPPQIAPHGPSEVRSLIGAFNTMAQRVSTALQQKDELIGSVGHDLRTPLASLRVQAEAITDDAVRQPLIDTVDELARLVDDTLDIARLGHTTEAPRLVDAAALIDAVVEEYKSHGAAVDFANAPRAVILCRTGLIRRLLRNVIDNALKYGGRAHLDLVEEGARLTLFVRDEGPGVAPDALERLTQPFVRLETSRNRSTGGSGLGLAIAQRIAETEGASLAFENGQGGGFVVAISWGPASVRPRQAQAS